MNSSKIFILFVLIHCSIHKLKSNILSLSSENYLILEALKNKKIAIIPCHISFSNNFIKNLDINEIESLSMAHSLAYQKELESILIEKHRGNFIVENIQTTNKKLKDSGIDLRIVWTYSMDSLQNVLGADAIMYMKIEQSSPFSSFEYYNLFFPDLYDARILLFPIKFNSSFITKKDIKVDFRITLEDKRVITGSSSIKSNNSKSTDQNIRKVILSAIKVLEE